MVRFLFLSLLTCVGCFQTSDDGSDLRTVPVTNNPYVVPNHGGGMPGGGASGTGPY
jgi:hypothetical protein